MQIVNESTIQRIKNVARIFTKIIILTVIRSLRKSKTWARWHHSRFYRFPAYWESVRKAVRYLVFLMAVPSCAHDFMRGGKIRCVWRMVWNSALECLFRSDVAHKNKSITLISVKKIKCKIWNCWISTDLRIQYPERTSMGLKQEHRAILRILQTPCCQQPWWFANLVTGLS
jgi:hypothetical protein